MVKNSSEFDYSGTADTERVIKKSGPSGLLIVFYIAASVLGIVILGLWWFFM